MEREEYNRILRSTPKSRRYVVAAAAFVNVALRAAPTVEEMARVDRRQINEVTARTFAVMMNLAFALETAIKGFLDDEILEEVGIGKVKRNGRDGHDLEYLYGKLPNIEREQLKTTVESILLIDDSEFDDLLKICRDGFVNWRYFYEEENLGKTCEPFKAISFLYSAVYYFISNTGMAAALENDRLKMKEWAHVGESGLLRQQCEIRQELMDAIRISQEDGDGGIAPTDMEWIHGIEKRLQETVNHIAMLICQA